jgi:hypothetical protein
VLDIKWLRFSRAEVSEYVRKCFSASTSDFEALVRARFVLLASSFRPPSAAEWIRKVETSSLYQDKDGKLTKALTDTRAMPSQWRRQRLYR